MRLAISNIAWEPSEDAAVADLLAEKGLDAVDVAPGKYFPDPSTASDRDIERVRSWWERRGFEITGMQSLLFGTTGLNLFAPPEVQDAMLAHLGAVCRIGAGLGATRLVFGSPRNRDRTGLADAAALRTAEAFFRRLGDLADAQGVCVCLEPNPERYGSNFMTTAEETARVVDSTAHHAIGLQLDLGALTITGEDLEDHLSRHGGLVRHVHASEPDLVPLGDGATPHHAAAQVLTRLLPDHVVSIEMVATQDEPHLSSIARALDVAASSYGDPETRR